MIESHPRSRYDVTGNIESQYVDNAETVLVNRLRITDLTTLQVAEESALAKAYESLLREVKVDTPLTCDLIKHIHEAIFGELFAWAGRWRRVNISKPGVIWPAAAFLEQSMQTFERDVLRRFPNSSLTTDTAFCSAIGETQGEFLAIHPFREGNARTIKLASDLLAVQTGRPLLQYDQSDAGADAYILAASAALSRKDYRPMTSLIEQALMRARQH
ncbi:MAG: cell filamentation protein [Planctomycetota bacterium]|nr:MAG: cell filamentation protein [Planctomycetota bacterium]